MLNEEGALLEGGNWACGTGLEFKGCSRKAGSSSWGGGLALPANAGPPAGRSFYLPSPEEPQSQKGLSYGGQIRQI